MGLLQNFSVPADNDVMLDAVVLNVPTLAGAEVIWRVYPQSFGAPVDGAVPIISKSSLSGGGGITILTSPQSSFVIQLHATDTFGLALGNYFHEATVIDGFGERSTVWSGLMTLTLSENV